MGALDGALALLGANDQQDASQQSKYGTPSELLDRLKMTESSGDSYAVNKKTGAMGPYQFMPGTVAMLHKQGIKFNPFDEQEARDAADFYIQKLANQNGGDMNKALASYGGFVTKDPGKYVASVTGQSQAQSAQQNQSGPLDDAISILSQPSVAAQYAQQDAGGKSVQADESKTLVNQTQQLGGMVGHAVTGLGASIIGGYHGIAKGVSALVHGGSIDDAVNAGADAVNQDLQRFTWQGTKPAQKEGVDKFGSPANPLNWPGIAGNYVGDKVFDVAGPAAGTAANVATQFLVPYKAGKLGGKVARGFFSDEAAGAASANTGATSDPARGGPTAPASNRPEVTPGSASGPQTAGQQPQPTTSANAPAQAPSLAVSAAEQARRAQILSDIGIQEARRSVIAGDPKAAATDFQTAKLDGPAGDLMKSKFIEERQALENHADRLVHETGGTVGTDQSALYGRGNTIIAPLDAFKSWFDSRISDLYKTADERSQGVPTQLDRFRTVLSDDSEMTNSDRVHLRDAISAYAKKLGVIGDDGTIFSNGQQAETMRKYLGENWTPQNSRFIAKLKDALDEDIMEAAGEDVYGEARKMRTLRGATLDDPKGIAKLMDSSGPEGINRAVSVEKIPDAVTGMPVDQFNHVVQTLKNVPPEIQPQAQAALAEIKAQFANKIAETGKSTKGQWNSKAVNGYLKNNAERMVQVFSQEELQRFKTLKDAGDILTTDSSYPGAAVQERNLLRSGVMSMAKKGAEKGVVAGGALAGHAVGGGIGAFVGGELANKAITSIGDAAALRQAQKRLVPLRSVLGGQ